MTNALLVVEHLKQTGNVEEQPKSPSLQRQPSNKSSSSTSSPAPTARRVYTPPSPTQAQVPKLTNVPPMDSLEEPSGVRFYDRAPTVRASPPRTFPSLELSTIDQKWGRLFDNEGNPTQRLGQFLRGLANHIVCLQKDSYHTSANEKVD